MQSWLNYFEWSSQNRIVIPWERGLAIEPHLRRPLIRSLQKFQLGESGEGRRLKRHAARTGDPTYAAAIDLFIKEEQAHARMMAKILTGLNAPLIKKHWSQSCFSVLRRLFGLNQELMVLLLPEMIAKRYFRVLHDGTQNPVLRAVCAQIARDEDGHLAFHTEYLRQAFEKMSFSRRIVVQVVWRLLYRASCVAMMADHWAVLRASGATLPGFWRECGEVFDEVAAGIFSPARVLAPVRLMA